MSDNTNFVSVTTQKKECKISLYIKSGQIMTAVKLPADFKLSIIYFHRQIMGWYFIWFAKLKQTWDFHKIQFYVVDGRVMTVYVGSNIGGTQKCRSTFYVTRNMKIRHPHVRQTARCHNIDDSYIKARTHTHTHCCKQTFLFQFFNYRFCCMKACFTRNINQQIPVIKNCNSSPKTPFYVCSCM